MVTLPSQEQSIHVLGIRVDLLNMTQTVDKIIQSTATADSPKVAVGINAHVCNQSQSDQFMRDAINSADLTYADGQSIVWASRLLGHALQERVATTDLVFPLAREASREGLRIFFYGGSPGVADRAAQRLEQEYPSLGIESAHGYVSKHEMTDLINRINDFRTDILFVGLGDPLQQEWIHKHRHTLRVSFILTCGGLFDWTAGDNRRPPQWLVRAGFEWLWRVFLEPRRLAGRYLKGNPAFIARFVRQLTTQSKHKPVPS